MSRITLLIVTSLIMICSLGAQRESLKSALARTDESNFFEIQETVNNFYKINPEAAGQTQWRRYEWFMEQRLYPSGRMENLATKTINTYQQYLQTLPASRSTHGAWQFIGPTNWNTGNGSNFGQGRVNSIDFHPTNSNIIFVGTPNAGIWKSSNGGASWTNISPNLPLLSIADLEVHPTNANIIYALTGDGDPQPSESNAHSQTEVSSIGVIKTTDGGSNWYPTNFSFGHPSAIVPTKLLMHPTNSNIQYIVAKNGIFKTIDGWNTNTQVFFSLTYDIEFKPGNPMIMYSSGSSSIRKSIDGGDIWTTVSDPDFPVLSSSTRIELAVADDFPTMVYAIAGNWSNGSIAFFQSFLEGINNSWIVKDTTTNIVGAFADYCIAMTVKPTDYRDVFAGGVGSWRSLSQGASGTWTQINNGVVHADIHDMAYHNGALYIAADGGLYKSTDDGNTWTDLSPGLAISEIYRITGTPQNTNLYIIGAQDIGHHKRTSGSLTFTNIGCCDGMASIIDYTNQNIMYISGQFGGINKSINGGTSFTTTGNPGTGGEWITPYIMDPVIPDILFVGKDSVHRTDNGSTSWQYIGSPSFGDLNVLEQGTNNRNRLYASDGGLIWRTNNGLVATGAATWTSISLGLPGQFITGITINPSDADEVFVSLSGYADGNKVFKSNNGGLSGSWTNISGSLPNLPVNCIEYYDNGQDALYIGTDIGVFYRDNTLGDWIYYSNFLPAVNISDLYINTASNTIAAGTYGRGMWLSDLYDGCDPAITLTGFFGPVGGTRYYSAGTSISSSADYKKDLGTEIHYKAGNFIDLTDGFELGGQAYFEGRIGPCPDIASEPFVAPTFPSGHFLMQNQTPESIKK